MRLSGGVHFNMLATKFKSHRLGFFQRGTIFSILAIALFLFSGCISTEVAVDRLYDDYPFRYRIEQQSTNPDLLSLSSSIPVIDNLDQDAITFAYRGHFGQILRGDPRFLIREELLPWSDYTSLPFDGENLYLPFYIAQWFKGYEIDNPGSVGSTEVDNVKIIPEALAINLRQGTISDSGRRLMFVDDDYAGEFPSAEEDRVYYMDNPETFVLTANLLPFRTHLRAVRDGIAFQVLYKDARQFVLISPDRKLLIGLSSRTSGSVARAVETEIVILQFSDFEALVGSLSISQDVTGVNVGAIDSATTELRPFALEPVGEEAIQYAEQIREYSNDLASLYGERARDLALEEARAEQARLEAELREKRERWERTVENFDRFLTGSIYVAAGFIASMEEMSEYTEALRQRDAELFGALAIASQSEIPASEGIGNTSSSGTTSSTSSSGNDVGNNRDNPDNSSGSGSASNSNSFPSSPGTGNTSSAGTTSSTIPSGDDVSENSAESSFSKRVDIVLERQMYTEDTEFVIVVPNTDRVLEMRVQVEYSEIFDYVMYYRFDFRSLTDDEYEVELISAETRNAEPGIANNGVAIANPNRWSLTRWSFSSNNINDSVSVILDSLRIMVSSR